MRKNAYLYVFVLKSNPFFLSAFHIISVLSCLLHNHTVHLTIIQTYLMWLTKTMKNTFSNCKRQKSETPSIKLSERNETKQGIKSRPESNRKEALIEIWTFFLLALCVCVWYFIQFTCVLCSFIPFHSIIYWLRYILDHCFMNLFCS